MSARSPSRQCPGILQRLRRDNEGATLTEFGLISPVLFMMIMGIFDMAHLVYTSSLVDGAMQSAARALTIEGATLREAQIDQRVEDQVRSVVPSTADIKLEKLSYDDFSAVGKPEEFTDSNNDGICNNGEVYADTNGNGQWDANRGAEGIGGARDVVLYRVTVTYPRLFPIYKFIGIPQNATVQGSTVLRNQPFDEQNRTVSTGNCT
jgi:Flp pilus assembly pilin Flp